MRGDWGLDLTKLPLIVIAGPTGVGKTNLSIAIAHRWQGEVINGDSLQVYRHLDIGTGKITPAEMEGIPHHLFDILAEDQPFDVSQFQTIAGQKVVEIAQRGHLPIVVGGTGLYLEGLIYQMDLGYEESHDKAVRQAWQEKADTIGDKALWQLLAAKDPQAAAKIPYQNVRRTIRALEVIQVTGRLFSDQEGVEERKPRFHSCLIFLERPRPLLYDRINRRVEMMVEQGLEHEVRNLYQRSQGRPFQSLQGIGYKEWLPYFEGHIDRSKVIQQIQQNSRRYAKRQLTWFRNRFVDAHWVDMNQEGEGLAAVNRLIAEHLAALPS